MNKIKFILPLGIFALIFIFLAKGLSLHPNEIPSPLINQSAPAFQLPSLSEKNAFLTHKNLMGHVSVLSIWASWCEACKEENAILLELRQNKSLQLIGIAYKDDKTLAKKWLEVNGNPYHLVGIDTEGKTAIDFGVYGTPETFIIDKKGIIRYKQIGLITPEVWDKDIKPLILRLQADT